VVLHDAEISAKLRGATGVEGRPSQAKSGPRFSRAGDRYGSGEIRGNVAVESRVGMLVATGRAAAGPAPAASRRAYASDMAARTPSSPGHSQDENAGFMRRPCGTLVGPPFQFQDRSSCSDWLLSSPGKTISSSTSVNRLRIAFVEGSPCCQRCQDAPLSAPPHCLGTVCCGGSSQSGAERSDRLCDLDTPVVEEQRQPSQ